MSTLTHETMVANAYGELAALAFGPPDGDCPAEADDARPCTEEDACWAAETSPLDGGWVEGEMSPFDLELLTTDALTHFSEDLDPAADDRRWDDGAERARWDDWTGRGCRPY